MMRFVADAQILNGNREQLQENFERLVSVAARMQTALEEIIEYCRNGGRGNEVVDARIVERVEETALAALNQ